MLIKRIYSLLGRGLVFHFNNLEPHPPKDALNEVWLKLALYNVSGEDLKILSIYVYYLPLVIFSTWKGHGPSFKQICIPFTLG